MRNARFLILALLVLTMSQFCSDFCSAKNVKSEYLIKYISKNEVIEHLESYMISNNYKFSRKGSDIYVVLPPDNLNIFTFNLFGSPEFKIQLNESDNGVKVDILGETGFITGDSFGYKSGKILIQQFRNEYSIVSAVGLSLDLSKKKRKAIRKEREKALLNLVKKIDVAGYSKVDPKFEENMKLISENIYRTNDKIIKPFNDEHGKLFVYRITQGTRSVLYNSDGKLKNILELSRIKYPRTTYVYNHPSGLIEGFNVALAQNECYSFSPAGQGKYVDLNNYINKFQKKIVANWHPPKHKYYYKIVISFTINKNGELISYELINSSENEDLNKMAVDAFLKALPADPLPNDYLRNDITIHFKFENKLKYR